ncbi:MAG: hypothetical protein KAW92_04225 [Candidatus Cloacimonetes bacterium]|nr:hypothetical protein [Candidatus Cloacimonadota bacterium]
MIKKILCFSLISVMVGLQLNANCKEQKGSPPNLYTDPQCGYRISCPDSGWTITDETGIPEVLVIIKSKAMIEDFIPNVTITIEFLSNMMTAEQYGEKNRKSLATHRYEVIFWKKTIINHNTFYDLQCLNKQVSPSLRFRYLCLVKNRVGFIITCTVPEKHYTEFIRDFEFIVKSFRFL